MAITLGDPRGIGPEIVAKALGHSDIAGLARFVMVGPAGAGVQPDDRIGEWTGIGGAAEAGALAGRAVERAASLAMRGEVQGIVTAPLDKRALLDGGYSDPGHTELLARLTGAEVAMMLAGTPRGGAHPLRVVLVTTHLPLRAVAQAVTGDAIVRSARITARGLREWYGIERPRLALCALNPHGGDGGRFGREDEDVLAPAARAADIDGPFSADTVFVRAMRGEFDAVLAPYHDVGMTAIKVAAFGSAVNVTLGLPFPRTSPDHGTAFDIAGQGIADPSSMIAAIRECARIAGVLSGFKAARDREQVRGAALPGRERRQG